MNRKIWNWQAKEWPHFTYNEDKLRSLELEFYRNVGYVFGAFKHVNTNEKEQFLIEVLSNEALKTSEIEGEYLDRDSIQSSIKKNLGLSVEQRKVKPAEFGISEMMVGLYKNFDKPLSHDILYNWHHMLTNGRRDLADIGKYRTHEDPMQVVSGRLDKHIVHYEAPPSHTMRSEMDEFVKWFNNSHDSKTDPNTSLIKAGVTHLYFVSIHPFEDGNGRIGRALAEKSLSISLEQPSLISLSKTIEFKKNEYYNALANNNKTCEITDWLLYFGQTIIDAQKETLKLIDFIIEKAKFYDQYSNQLNERQLKVSKRLFEAGPQGFLGGLSAENYARIAKTSASTTTRDLKDMVDKGALVKTGALKSTRYWLPNLDIGILP